MGQKVFASGMNYGAVTLGAGDVTQKFSALYIGGAGNVSIMAGASATPVVFTAVPEGSILPVKGELIDDDLTTATLLVWLDW